jgi:hypothetical protein
VSDHAIPDEVASLRARLVEVEREATASRACIEFDPPSEPAQIVARLRLIVENHNKQCGDFVTQRNSAWQRAIEIGKAKKAAESRASAAEGALRAAEPKLRHALGTMQKPLSDMVKRCVADLPHNHDHLAAIRWAMREIQEAHETLLALSGLPPLTSETATAAPGLPLTPAALVPKEEDK